MHYILFSSVTKHAKHQFYVFHLKGFCAECVIIFGKCSFRRKIIINDLL